MHIRCLRLTAFIILITCLQHVYSYHSISLAYSNGVPNSTVMLMSDSDYAEMGVGATLVPYLDTVIVTMGTSLDDCRNQGFRTWGGSMCDPTWGYASYGWGCWWSVVSSYPVC